MGAIWISHVLKQIGFQTFPERYGAHLDFAPLVRHVLLVPASPFRSYLVEGFVEGALEPSATMLE